MKKQLLALAVALLICGGSFAQQYYSLPTTGTKSPYLSSLATNPILVQGSNNVLSTGQTIPFTWTFYGKQVTTYKACDNGYITFDANATIGDTNNVALPNVTAPLNAIFAFWDELELKAISGSPTIKTEIRNGTYGTAPNRIHVIQWWTASKKGIAAGSTNYLYFAIRLYEGGNFDIVYNDGAPGLLGLTATIGCQNDNGTDGTNIAGPNADFPNKIGTQSNQNITDRVYTFKPGPQAANEIQLSSLNKQKYVTKNAQVPITGTVTNNGTQSLISFKLNYSIDNGPVVIMQLSGLNVAPNGGKYNFTHNMPYVPTSATNSTIKVWVTSPNTSVDADSSDNQLSYNIIVLDKTVPRKVLHEIFTSSTCPPCKPGNENLHAVLNAKSNWNVIKYQENFPGEGDPYYTLENGARFNYYGAGFAPWLTVDGSSTYNANAGEGANANYYTESHFDTKSAVGALATIAATYTRTGNTITVAGSVTPVQALTNPNVKLRIAIIERTTLKNVKSNGESEFYNVNKKMLPNAAGSTLNFSAGTPVTFTQSYTIPGTFRLPANGQSGSIINLTTENSIEEAGALSAILFVQDDDDKFVWQSYATGPVWALGVSEVTDLGLSLYPNPAATSFNVTFSGESNSGSVRIIDMNGKEVLNQSISNLNGSVNCDFLQNGLYFVELNANGKTAVKKLNIIR